MSRDTSGRATVVACAAVALAITSGSVAAQTAAWQLESTVQRVVEVAPERRAAEADVMARQGEWQQAGLWSNPSVELGASNAMGKEDGQGGSDLHQITLRQPLPLSGRLTHQRHQAQANLQQAHEAVAERSLALEYEGARVFHRLQLNLALLQLAEHRLQSADEFQRIGQRREEAGDLSRLERLRLDLIRENANQQIATAEGEAGEAKSDFRTLLNLAEGEPSVAPLEQLPILPAMAALERAQAAHPALVAARQAIESARYGVAVARANRFADPEIWLSRGRDVLGGERQDVTAFGVAVTVPLWDRNKGHIDTAQAGKQKAQFELEALQRQLGNHMRLNHLHLGHLIEQTEEYRTKVLKPAEQLFALSRKGFAAGEVEILALVDAVNSHFEARARYIELLDQAWLEAAELRRSAGISLTTSTPTSEGAPQ